jgi:hypothetical protein
MRGTRDDIGGFDNGMRLVSAVILLSEICTLCSKCWTVQYILNTTFPFMLYWRQNSSSLSSLYFEEYAYSCIICVFCYLCLGWFLLLLLLLVLLGGEVLLPIYYTFVCIYIYTHIHIHIQLHSFVCVCVCIYIYTYIHTHTHTQWITTL